VHPYLRRRSGEEPVTYPHPILEPCLRKTLGVPLFQEQLMQIGDRRRPGSAPGKPTSSARRWARSGSRARMAAMRERLVAGMAERGITGDVAAEIAQKLEAFADFGFPESHSVSFAYLVYASAWLKRHYPASFTAALLNSQPMGFYSPHTLVRDAIRHGVQVLGPCVHASRRDCTLEPRTPDARPRGFPGPGWHADVSTHAIRIGLRYVRGLSERLLDRIDEARAEQPFVDLEDFTRRTGATVDALESLATAGAFARFGVRTSRGSLGCRQPSGTPRPDTLPGPRGSGVDAQRFPG